MSNRLQIVHPDWVITVNAGFDVLTDTAVVVEDGRIHSLVAAAEIDDLPFRDQASLLRLSQSLLMPGLVNSHTHASMSLFRGLADDLPLMTWLGDHIWPAEGRWIDPIFVADGYRLAAIEMLRGGTTCLNDMYYFPDEAARVAQSLGMRAAIGLIVLDLPTVWAQDADDYLAKALAVHEEIGEMPLISTTLAPHAPYTVSDEPLSKIARYSAELDLPVHMHVHETAQEVSDALRDNGVRPLERLDRLGLLNSRLLAVHMTTLNEAEIEQIARAGVNVAHCPESNLKLGSGICPLPDLLEAGVNVCLGTDGAASNNDLDMLGEMRTAAMLAKGYSGDAAVCNSRQTIEMATINGARALGLGDRIGSLEAGKRADMIAVDLSSANTQPVYDPAAQLVYAANSRQVSHVWVDGVPQIEDGRFTRIDEADILARAQHWGYKIGVGHG